MTHRSYDLSLFPAADQAERPVRTGPSSRLVRSRRAAGGFTLIEIMVVIVIMVVGLFARHEAFAAGRGTRRPQLERLLERVALSAPAC